MDTSLETEEPDVLPVKIERTKYYIHCDACQQNFYLILERPFDKELLADHDATAYLQRMGNVRTLTTTGELKESSHLSKNFAGIIPFYYSKQIMIKC